MPLLKYDFHKSVLMSLTTNYLSVYEKKSKHLFIPEYPLLEISELCSNKKRLVQRFILLWL